jgi:hypothetical protein
MPRIRNGFLQGWFLFAAVFIAGSVAWAARIDPGDYPFPYKNPYVATGTVAILKGRDEQTHEIGEALRIKVLPDRNRIRFLEGEGTLRYRFQPQGGPAPLVFVIPGFGGSAYTGSSRYVAGLLFDQGFHVLTLPSPFNWNFALAASRSGFPGMTRRDGEDLYAAMEEVLRDVESRYHPAIDGIRLVGFSHGALMAAFLSEIDSQRKAIGFTTTLLVNPPVDLLAAIDTIERMGAIGKRYSQREKDDLQAYAFGVAGESLQRDIDSPAYFADWDRRLRLGDDAIKYLISTALTYPVGSTIYAIELAFQPGVLESPFSSGYRSAWIEEARSYGLKGYIDAFLTPAVARSTGQPFDLGGFAAASSLRSLEQYLKSNPRVFVMHNADDFLVSADDLAFLEEVFGSRAIIYPYGGHLGNLWFPRNKRDLVGILEARRR